MPEGTEHRDWKEPCTLSAQPPPCTDGETEGWKVEERDDWKQMSLGAEYLLESKSRSANVHLSVFFTFQGSEPHILDAQ